MAFCWRPIMCATKIPWCWPTCRGQCASHSLSWPVGTCSWKVRSRLICFDGRAPSASIAKELTAPQTGSLEQRLSNLIDAVLNPLEDEWVQKQHDGSVNSRVKRLRTAILPEMIKNDIEEPERQRRWKQLADVYVANQLHHYPPDY